MSLLFVYVGDCVENDIVIGEMLNLEKIINQIEIICDHLYQGNHHSMWEKIAQLLCVLADVFEVAE